MTDSSQKPTLTSNDEVYYAMLRAAWACEDCNGQGHNFVPGACKTCQTCRSLRDALLTVRGPFMSLDSKPGDKVRYHWGLAGYDGDVSYARKHLTLGAVYTIKRLDVYDSTSTLLLEEVLGGFNPVQFAPLAENETECPLPASDRNTILDAMHYPREYLARWKGKGNSANAQHTLDRLQNMLERTQAGDRKETPGSRSIQRRVAAQKGDPIPEFGASEKAGGSES